MNSGRNENAVRPRRIPFLVPTPTRQSLLFMIGSALFAGGSALSIGNLGSATTANLLCFVGAWFFTTAGLFQLILSGQATTMVNDPPARMLRPEWLAAATQSVGTVLFNVSTTAALTATTVASEEQLVWTPDAGGSLAFLVSAVFVVVAYVGDRGRVWEPRRADWWSGLVNMIGCLAFGVSAVASFVLADGAWADPNLANGGTFIGAICFFLASAVVLPRHHRRRPARAGR